MRASEPVSFWRENEIADVVSLIPGDPGADSNDEKKVETGGKKIDLRGSTSLLTFLRTAQWRKQVLET